MLGLVGRPGPIDEPIDRAMDSMDVTAFRGGVRDSGGQRQRVYLARCSRIR
jgi:ABC-type bacteriocin/lantibiotic exporter with double-glycine peptidase domain